MSKLVRLSDLAYQELDGLKTALGANDFDGVVRVLLTVYEAQILRYDKDHPEQRSRLRRHG